jgi:hypothetical protein
MSPVRYELGLYISENDIRHSRRRENLKSYIALMAGLCRFPVRYVLGFYILEDCILHIHRRENVKSYKQN